MSILSLALALMVGREPVTLAAIGTVIQHEDGTVNCAETLMALLQRGALGMACSSLVLKLQALLKAWRNDRRGHWRFIEPLR